VFQEFNVLLIPSRTKFWCATLAPKYI